MPDDNPKLPSPQPAQDGGADGMPSAVKEALKQSSSFLKDSLKKTTSPLADAMTSMSSSVTSGFSAIKDNVNEIVDNTKAVVNAAAVSGSALKDNLEKATVPIAKVVTTMSSSVASGFSEIKDNVSGLVDNTRAVVGAATEKLSDTSSAIFDNIKSQKERYLQERRDRKDARREEKRAREDQKLEDGSRFQKLSEAFGETATKMGGAIQSAFGSVGDIFNNAFDNSPVAKAFSGAAAQAWQSLKEQRQKRKEDKKQAENEEKQNKLQEKRQAEDLAVAKEGLLGNSPLLGTTNETLEKVSGTLDEMLGRTPTTAEQEEAKADAAAAAGDMGDGGGGDDGGDSGGSKKEGFLGGIIGGLGRGLGALGRGIKGLGKGIGGAVRGILTGIAHGLIAFANPMVLAGAVAMGLAIGAILITLGAVSKILKVMNVDFTPLRELFTAFTPIIEALGTAFGNLIRPITEMISTVLVALVDKLNMIEPLILGLAAAFNTMLAIIQPIVLSVVDFLKIAAPLIDSVITTVADFATVFLNTFSTALTTIKELILGTIEGVVGGIERFAALDGTNLMSVGAGMLAISAGLAAFGVGGALAGVGGAIGAFFGGDPVEKFKKFAEIADPLKRAGEGAFFLGEGIKALASVNLNRLGKQIGPFVAAIKEPLKELSEIEFSTAQANVLTELLSKMSADGKDALAASQTQAGAVVTNQVNNNMAQSTTAPVFPKSKTIDTPPEMWATRADF